MLICAHEKFKRLKADGEDTEGACEQTATRNPGIFKESKRGAGRGYCGRDKFIF